MGLYKTIARRSFQGVLHRAVSRTMCKILGKLADHGEKRLKNTYGRYAWISQLSCFQNRPRRRLNECTGNAIPVIISQADVRSHSIEL